MDGGAIIRNFIKALPFPLTCEDRSVSYLPLSHVAAQVPPPTTYLPALPRSLARSLAQEWRPPHPPAVCGLWCPNQMLDIHCPIYTGARIYFAQPDALRGSLGVTLKVTTTTRQAAHGGWPRMDGGLVAGTFPPSLPPPP